MNAAPLVWFGWALVFAAGCAVLGAQLGHAQGNLPPVTGGPPSRLVAASSCCQSGLAQIVMMLPAPARSQFNYGNGWKSLARTWLGKKVQQQRIIRTRLGDIALVVLLRATDPTLNPANLSVSVDPQSKLLKVFFRVSDNQIRRLTHTCGTFDLEVAMIFQVTSGVALRSSEVRSSNFVPTGVCSNFQSIGDRLNSEAFDDAGTAIELANIFNYYLRRAANAHGVRIRAVTPGVRPEDVIKTLVFEITPVEVALPTRDIQ